jgi:hypothetical protein
MNLLRFRRDMGEFYLIFWRRNYPHDRGTRPPVWKSGSGFHVVLKRAILHQ